MEIEWDARRSSNEWSLQVWARVPMSSDCGLEHFAHRIWTHVNYHCTSIQCIVLGRKMNMVSNEMPWPLENKIREPLETCMWCVGYLGIDKSLFYLVSNAHTSSPRSAQADARWQAMETIERRDTRCSGRGVGQV